MSETKNIKKMKAVRLHAIGDLRCDEMEVPVPKGEELLIKVGACGVCGSDYPRTYEHGTSSGIYPLTIGHEFAGEVVAAGSKENEALIGTKAAIYPLIPCRKCDPCVTGNYAMCEHYDYLGSRRDGGFAEYCLLPSKWQLIVAKNASMEELAMTEPACVAQHAVRRADVQAGQYVVIFGAGPIGIMAARWVKLFGATPLLVDIAQDKVEFAIEKGLDAINSRTTNVSEEIRNRNHGKLADAAIEGTGAGVIFGATGGVMEAALRSAYFLLKGENPPADAFRSVRAEGFNANHGVQEADFQIDDITVRTAVVSVLGNTRALLNKIEKGEVHYDFVEVMACPGGCVGGGGQPIHDGEELAFERGKNLYQLDESANLRYSHENPDINLLYEEYFEKPNSHKAHMLLHTDHLESMELYGTGYCDYSKK